LLQAAKVMDAFPRCISGGTTSSSLITTIITSPVGVLYILFYCVAPDAQRYILLLYYIYSTIMHGFIHPSTVHSLRSRASPQIHVIFDYQHIARATWTVYILIEQSQMDARKS
jgi:hypothetical protein